jgi:hypothetical protein
MFKKALLSALCGISSLGLAACSASPDDTGTTQSDDLTGANSAERAIHFESSVIVEASASDPVIRAAIARQVKTAIGALRDTKVSLDDRDAQSNLSPSKWTRTALTFKDPQNPGATRPLTKITFKYDDRAVVINALSTRSAVDFTMLAGDYAAHADTLRQSCADDSTSATDSLWYHFQPGSASCMGLIQAELSAIAQERKSLDATSIGPKELGRWFQPTTARLDPAKVPAAKFAPEYDRLFGVGTDKSELLVYAFLGVDGYAAQDAYNPDDILGKEAMKFYRTMLRAQPNLRPVKTEPSAMLLDLYVDGKKLDGVTYERMLSWVIDQTNLPAEVQGNAAKTADLRRQVMTKFAERWIDWVVPMQVTSLSGATKAVNLRVRSYYGQEDGTPDARQHAQWRYLEAFWYGDVFLYNGHSHFGNGPLEPQLYGSQNWNDRYQVMLVNSCISFNYYHEDFLRMKPGGSRNLDMVVNGLPSYVNDGGVASALFFASLTDGTMKSYVDILRGMQLDMPWGEKAYDPMRVVDGELDNTFDQSKAKLSVRALAPVY